MSEYKPWQDPRYADTRGNLDFTLRTPVKIFRNLTFNSPLVGAGALGLLAGGIGYKLAPYIDRILSPKFGGGRYYDDLSEDQRKKRKLLWGTGAGLLTAMGFLSTQYTPDRPWNGMKTYAPMTIPKHASFDGLRLDDCSRLIMSNDDLTREQKENSLRLLNSFDAPPQTVVTGNNLVGQAIGSGITAATGAAVGFLTAKALGLPNPRSTAILGAVGSTLGVGPALTLSTVFGQ